MGNGLSPSELKEFLEEKHVKYNALGFIDSDPIQVPHMFHKKEDIEICYFLTSTIAWGTIKTIIKRKISALIVC